MRREDSWTDCAGAVTSLPRTKTWRRAAAKMKTECPAASPPAADCDMNNKALRERDGNEARSNEKKKKKKKCRSKFHANML